MTETHATSASWLLANREHLSLKKATGSLVGRVRVRTPLGAVEYLRILSGLTPGVYGSDDRLRFARAQETTPELRRRMWDTRVQLAITINELYRDAFPQAYARSQAPCYSVRREHEFYELVNQHLFPIDLELTAAMPGDFLPAIPLASIQEHDWINGCCEFEDLQTVYQVALVLSGRVEHRGTPGWKRLGIDIEPAPPLNHISWPLFLYAIAIDDSPIRYFKDALNIQNYTTGNPWLDCPPGAYVGLEWSAEQVGKLTFARLQAQKLEMNVAKLNAWLDEAPAERISRLVEIWNKAARDAGEGKRLIIRH